MPSAARLVNPLLTEVGSVVVKVMSAARLDCRVRREVSGASGPCVLVLGLAANWVLMSPITVLNSITKLLIELVIAVVFGPTVNVTGVAGSALTRVSVTSGIAPVTVLVELA